MGCCGRTKESRQQHGRARHMAAAAAVFQPSAACAGRRIFGRQAGYHGNVHPDEIWRGCAAALPRKDNADESAGPLRRGALVYMWSHKILSLKLRSARRGNQNGKNWRHWLCYRMAIRP